MDMICRKTMQRCQTPGMCLPFQGCPDPAAQPLHDQLAAKDAEIAELRHRASNAELQRNLLQNQSNALLSERDEARECVGRLYPLASAQVARLQYESSLPMSSSLSAQVAEELKEARAALAATPEHLRNA